MTNADTATSAMNVAAIIDTVDAPANADDDPAEEPPPEDLPPLPLGLLPDLLPDLPMVDLRDEEPIAIPEEDAVLPDEDDLFSLFLSSSSLGSSYTFS